MLRSFAEFPHAGSQAFLASTAEPVRIIRHNGDGTVLIAAQQTRANPVAHREASGNRNVPRAVLFASADEATAPPTGKRRRRKAAA